EPSRATAASATRWRISTPSHAFVIASSVPCASPGHHPGTPHLSPPRPLLARHGSRTIRRFEVVEPAAQRAHRLADALLVLDQCEADEALATGAEAGPGRGRDAAVADEHRRELDRAELAVRLRDRRPDEHAA